MTLLVILWCLLGTQPYCENRYVAHVMCVCGFIVFDRDIWSLQNTAAQHSPHLLTLTRSPVSPWSRNPWWVVVMLIKTRSREMCIAPRDFVVSTRITFVISKHGQRGIFRTILSATRTSHCGNYTLTIWSIILINSQRSRSTFWREDFIYHKNLRNFFQVSLHKIHCIRWYVVHLLVGAFWEILNQHLIHLSTDNVSIKSCPKDLNQVFHLRLFSVAYFRDRVPDVG